MNVSDIIEQVANISLNEDNPDATLQARLLRYLNNGYRDVYRRMAKLDENRLLTSENVTITNGSGTLSVEPFYISQVVDTGNETVLIPSDLVTIERNDEDLDDTGNPVHYYITSGTTINTHPKNSTTIRVRYIPNSTELVITDTDSAIKIPEAYHDLLVEATLFYMYQDERDVRTVQEIQAARVVYEDKLGDLRRHLANQTRARIRSSYRDM